MEPPTRIHRFNSSPVAMKLMPGTFSLARSVFLGTDLRSASSLFSLDKSQCRGIDLQQKSISSNPYDEHAGIPLKGDNLARMLALRSGTNTCSIERLADEMLLYGLVRFGKSSQPSADLP